MPDQLSIAEIEERLKQEQADASAALSDCRAANARYELASKNVNALSALLALARAYANGDAMPDVRVPY